MTFVARLFGMVLLVSTLSSSARAYVLPADFLLRMLADKRRTMTFKDATFTYTAELSGEDTPVDERVYFKVPERQRVVQNVGEPPVVLVEREGKRASGPEGKLVKDASPILDPLPVLLATAGEDLEQKGGRMLAALAKVGVDTKVTAFGRLGDQVVYIIGARAFEPDKPQLWLYKNTFFPARFIYTGTDKAKYDIRWLEYGGPITADYYPGIIETYKDGKLVRRAEAQKMQLNSNLPESLFELPRS